MSKKNFTIAFSTLALLSTTSMQADELLEFDALGTGEEIRADILPVAAENPSETPEQRKARKKKEAEEAKKKGTKSTEGKCGKGTCS